MTRRLYGIDNEVSEHIRVELELQFKKIAEAIILEQSKQNGTVDVTSWAHDVKATKESVKTKGRCRLVRAAL